MGTLAQVPSDQLQCSHLNRCGISGHASPVSSGLAAADSFGHQLQCSHLGQCLLPAAGSGHASHVQC
eukprot:12013680-Karenia_brevis.AAC.1